jgi:mono/diheme cytochrome c family protein
MNVKLAGVSVFATAITVAALGADPTGQSGSGFKVQGSGFANPALRTQNPAPRTANPEPSTLNPEPQKSLVTKYCVTCHNDRAKTGGLSLQKVNLDGVPEGAETWEKVVRKLRGGMMPPLGAPRPEQANIDGFVSFLESSIDRAALASPNPGRSPLHRLNRSEYANAIRDLLALEIDTSAYLPADDEANGFDNIADVLKVSPSLLEQYLTASRKIAALAVGNLDTMAVSAVYRVPPDRAQADHIEGLPLGTRGGILIRHNFPLDADYDFRVNLLQNIVGYVPGLEWPHTLEITIDGERVFTAPVGGRDDNELSDTNLAAAKDALDQRLRTRVHVKAGPRAVGVAFIRKNAAESVEPLQPFTRDLDMQNMNGLPLIEHVQLSGPFNATSAGDTPSRRRIFVCRPASPREEPACAKTILSTLARRAYRRPIDTEIDTLLGFYESGRKKGTFDTGIEHALRFMLTSPKFLFRDEPDPANISAGTVYPVTDLELASRLSFFLWSSVPDDQLITVAAQGSLREPAVLDRQVKRMLADPKSKALVDNFAAQWLFVRNLQSFLPDTQAFPNFDDNLRQAFRQETELFVESVIRDDRNVLDLLTADYTFVNERLARHYGIPNVYGSRFRRVTLRDENRRGLLGEGTVLAVTSYPNRTSPVLRGKWILENILGTPPPPPPPNVPTLKENSEGGKIMSVRERLEEHRKNPACATCHRVMDPLGFSLDNFDATGEWRTKEAQDVPVDAAGQLADGTPVDGPVALRKALLKHPEQFVRTMTEKLLTYGLGRGLEFYDMPVVRAIARDAARQNNRFSALITGIVKSAPFQMKKAHQGEEQAPANTSARKSSFQLPATSSNVQLEASHSKRQGSRKW